MMNERFYPEEIEKIGAKSIKMVKEGTIRNHKLGNSAPIHFGEIEEQESALFSDFLTTRNCDIVNNLRGNDNA